MRYFKLPLESDLSQTSYRASASTETHEYIEYNEGYIDPSWGEVTEEQLIEVFGRNPFIDPEPEPEPSQLDRIESTLAILTADSITTSAVDEAITEGVNDV